MSKRTHARTTVDRLSDYLSSGSLGRLEERAKLPAPRMRHVRHARHGAS
jgi:hypothetical protein